MVVVEVPAEGRREEEALRIDAAMSLRCWETWGKVREGGREGGRKWLTRRTSTAHVLYR